MRKRVIPLLLLAVVVLASAPAALADHCRICKVRQGVPVCWPAVTGGKPICDDFTTPGTCVLSGQTCTGPHPFIEEPLAADYSVASVERLDEPNPAPAATRIASLETTPSANR
jgi:hypothetical protein